MTDNDVTLGSDFPPAMREQWLKLVDGVLKGAPYDKRLVSRSYDGLRIEPLYVREPSAMPVSGRAPGSPWQVLQRVDHPDPAAANVQALQDLDNGANGLTLAFAGSVGSRGFGIDSTLDALARVLDGVYLDAVALDLDLSWHTSDAPAHIVALARRRKIDPAGLNLRVNFDPLGSLAVSGTSLVGWDVLAPRFARQAAEMAEQGLRGPFALADGRVIHDAGGSEAQELAWVLASAAAYLRAFDTGEIALDRARRWISFKLAADADQFLTIAKFRALRLLWAHVEESSGVAPQPALVAGETAWRMMTRRDPWVNVLRTTIAAFAAGLGGANSVSVLPLTLALGLPDRFARRLARNTQIILLEESNLAKVADPAAGSGAIEEITRQLCDAAWKQFQEIERAGGAWAALEAGFVQGRIAAVRAERERAVAQGRDALTGTSAFPDVHEQPVVVLEAAPRALPASTDVEVRIDPLPPIRLAAPFEALREASDRMHARTGTRPTLFLANLGTSSDFTARATFAKNFFEAGGIEAVGNDGFPDPAGLGAAFKSSGAALACICSSDAVYAQAAAAAAQTLSAAGAAHIYLAGRPGDHEAEWKAAGVQSFIYLGCDMLETLQRAQASCGVAP